MDASIERVLSLKIAISYSYLATAVCVLYDHFLTLDDEIELVWKRSKWSVVQYMFIVNRYLGDMFQIYNAFIIVRHNVMKTSAGCYANHIVLVNIIMFIAIAMQGIILFRISSMYGHDRSIKILLWVVIVVEAVVNVILNTIAEVHSIPLPRIPGVVPCRTSAPARWIWVMWFLPCFFELLVLVLAVRIALQYRRTISVIDNMHLQTSRRGNLLIYVLLRDSIIFPTIALIVYILNPIAWTHLDPWEAQFVNVFSSFLPCIIGPRLILNLREAYYQPYQEEVRVGSRRSRFSEL